LPNNLPKVQSFPLLFDAEKSEEFLSLDEGVWDV